MKKLPIVRWFDDLKNALSIYIAGNVAPSGGVTAGKFYFWNGKLRFPTSNISAGETLTDSNMPVVPEGGLNRIPKFTTDTTSIACNNAANTIKTQAAKTVQGYRPIAVVGWQPYGGFVPASKLILIDLQVNDTIQVAWSEAITNSYGLNVRLLYVSN